MRRRLLDHLSCPRCCGALELKVGEERPNVWPPPPEDSPWRRAHRMPWDETWSHEVVSGELGCGTCGQDYPIVNGIPRFIGAEHPLVDDPRRSDS
jgi:uncharacterized protein YbaR (Trm112 family)